jgi:hypothetical protein
VYICSEHGDKPAYQPGLERWSAYKFLWIRHWQGFQEIYDERFRDRYGPLTKEKKEEAHKLIKCGRFRNGFVRHACSGCGTVLVVPFTCKSRLCVSCYRKKLFGWSLNLSCILNTNLNHFHVTFTVPGALSQVLFEKGYNTADMIKEASQCYRDILMTAAGLKGKEHKPGVIATVHSCGNGLNYNPHVHLIGTSELVNTETGEILENIFIPYKKARFIWMQHFLRHLVRTRIITKDEHDFYIAQYVNGFHVYFKPVRGNNNEILFRATEYIATGYMNNSQIVKVDNERKTVTFRYKSWVNRQSGEKSYAVKTMDIYEFMALMLFFLPDRNEKTIRYYGIYASGIREKLDYIEKKTWRDAVQHCFEKDPELCPQCGTVMLADVAYSLQAPNSIDSLIKTHVIQKGYFIPIKKPP